MRLDNMNEEDVQRIMDSLVKEPTGCIHYPYSSSGVTKVRVRDGKGEPWRWHAVNIKQLHQMVHGWRTERATYNLCGTKGCCNPNHYSFLRPKKKRA